MNYFFHPASESEHLEIIAYYESKKPGLGASYLSEFEHCINTILKNPDLYPVEREPGIRRAMLKKFPFAIIYREYLNTIQVLAIAHQRRRPEYWLGRS